MRALAPSAGAARVPAGSARVLAAPDDGAREGARPRGRGPCARRSPTLPADCGRTAVGAVTLFRSRLSPAGAVVRAAAASTIDLMWPILLGYLAGSVPFAFLLARRAGVDVRVAGSGNVGAANVLRTTGTRRGVILVMALDVAKGALAVALALGDARRRDADRAGRGRGRRRPHLSGLAAVPRRQGRRGRGRRVRGPDAAGDRRGRALFLVIVWLTRYVSLGSIAATVALPPAAWLTGEPIAGRDRRGGHRRADPVPPPRQHPAAARRHRARGMGAAGA